MSKDILLYESGSGGDFLIRNKDLVLVESLFQQCYIALFGGNLEADTLGNELPNQIREDYWANSLFHVERIEKQFNSVTERTLNDTALNSAGRNKIQNAVDTDLKYLKSIATITTNVSILSSSRVQILITLRKPDNLEDKTLKIIWDNASLETIEEITI